MGMPPLARLRRATLVPLPCAVGFAKNLGWRAKAQWLRRFCNSLQTSDMDVCLKLSWALMCLECLFNLLLLWLLHFKFCLILWFRPSLFIWGNTFAQSSSHRKKERGMTRRSRQAQTEGASFLLMGRVATFGDSDGGNLPCLGRFDLRRLFTNGTLRKKTGSPLHLEICSGSGEWLSSQAGVQILGKWRFYFWGRLELQFIWQVL